MTLPLMPAPGTILLVCCFHRIQQYRHKFPTCLHRIVAVVSSAKLCNYHLLIIVFWAKRNDYQITLKWPQYLAWARSENVDATQQQFPIHKSTYKDSVPPVCKQARTYKPLIIIISVQKTVSSPMTCMSSMIDSCQWRRSEKYWWCLCPACTASPACVISLFKLQLLIIVVIVVYFW